MIRVLQVVNIMDRAGLETMLMNYYRKIDRNEMQFDFLTHRRSEGAYDDEIRALGGRIYHAPRLYPQNYISYINFMQHFFKEHPEYKIVHSHIEAMSYLPLLTAKRAEIPIRIAHSHSCSLDRDYKFLLKKIFVKLIPHVANQYAASSKKAGAFLFGETNFTLIPDAIDCSKFSYSESLRKTKRQELGLDDKFVVGHVGRFTIQKNHEFLIKVFSQVASVRDNAVLLLVGKGELEDKIKKQVYEHKLSSKVIFLKERDDVGELYQAMDVFAFPSLSEGLGMVAVEAQMSGAKSIVSDQLPEEAIITDQTKILPLIEDKWVKEILDIPQCYERKTQYSDFFDINKAVIDLTSYYRNFIVK